jgi:hypothetical protein
MILRCTHAAYVLHFKEWRENKSEVMMIHYYSCYYYYLYYKYSLFIFEDCHLK